MDLHPGFEALRRYRMWRQLTAAQFSDCPVPGLLLVPTNLLADGGQLSSLKLLKKIPGAGGL
jgi:hypothetical protein